MRNALRKLLRYSIAVLDQGPCLEQEGTGVVTVILTQASREGNTEIDKGDWDNDTTLILSDMIVASPIQRWEGRVRECQEEKDTIRQIGDGS